MAVTQLKDGRWVVSYRKGTILEASNRTREYFGRGLAGRQAPEQRNKDLGFGRRMPQHKKNVPTFGDIAAQYQEAKFANNAASTKCGRYYKKKSVILPELGHLPVDPLTRRRLDQYVSKRLKRPATAWTGPESNRVKRGLLDADGNPRFVKATTVHRELSDIMAVMAWVECNRKIPYNPVAGKRPGPAQARPGSPGARQHRQKVSCGPNGRNSPVRKVIFGE